MWMTLMENLAYYMILSFLGNKLLSERYSFILRFVSILYFLFLTVLLHHLQMVWLDAYMFFLISALFLCIHYKGNLSHIFLFWILYSVNLLLAKWIVMTLFAPLFARSLPLLDVRLFEMIGIVFRTSIVFLAAYLCILFYQSYKEDLLTKKMWLILILPITTLLLIFNSKDEYAISNHYYTSTCIVIGLFIANFISLYVSNDTLLSAKNTIHLKKEKELSELKYQHVQSLLVEHNKSLHQIRYLARDTLALIDQQDMKQAQQYLLTIFTQTTKLYNITSSGFDALNVVIKEYMEEIQKEQIEVRIDCEQKKLSMSSADGDLFLRSMIHFAIITLRQTDMQNKLLYVKYKSCGEKQVLFSIILSCRKEGYDISSLLVEIKELINTYAIILTSEFSNKNATFAIHCLLNKQ